MRKCGPRSAGWVGSGCFGLEKREREKHTHRWTTRAITLLAGPPFLEGGGGG